MPTLAGAPSVISSLVPYGQGRGRGLGAEELGVHGEQMDRLVSLGLPTVVGITVPVSRARQLTDPALAREAVDLVEELTGRRVGSTDRPLLLRLVPSTPVAATGVPPDLPALGVCPANARALAELIGREHQLHDVWTTVLAVVAVDALDVDADDVDDVLTDTADGDRAPALLDLVARTGSAPFPDDPAEQLALAARALLHRWDSPRGRRARRAQGLPDDLGLALHVQALHVGPWERSGHGTASSRDPGTGAPRPHGTFHRGVSRRSTSGEGEPLSALPEGTDLLRHALATLENHLRAVATVTFELRDGKLALLSAAALPHPGARAGLRLAVDLATAGTIDRATAVRAVRPAAVQELLHAQLRLTGAERELARGLAASPGAASGVVALSAERALELSGDGVPVVLVSTETTPADVPALVASAAVVTSAGGLASHAAVVARGTGTPAVCGVAELCIDRDAGTVTAHGHTVREGERVTVDGRAGTVYLGELDVRPAEPSAELDTLLSWADAERTLGVRANADNAAEAEAALRLGAEGIGLCRTEHQFLGDRLPVVRRFLLAPDEDAHRLALDALTAAQQADFTALLQVTGDRPVTVRLLDAPLHEFLPHDEVYADPAHARRAAQLREVNPMLGLRGVRLALLEDDLYAAQAEALFSAWVTVAAAGTRPRLEVMVPMVSIPQELELAIGQVRRAADRVERTTGVRVPYQVGSMVETPRAALLADRLAEHADFLSFGTNDLTQMTFGFSRDDVESRLLAHYVGEGLLTASPFAEFDADGVGALVAIAVQKARAVRPDIKLGLCGEHGGDAVSVGRLAALGLDYVSCSPQRVPVARLAAAHAALQDTAEERAQDRAQDRAQAAP
ncbi:pyruvate, phosphate dikinase [Modestobacter sp. I12A-02628]|uniref:Pyruvate, phosphate dikinase n=1 Tax=Goekera deserti TaxID=2497753 RepID=A0A7K3WIB7_9ACTN|nr:putative PEP-binding protein [Goekera deserti]MPQ96545.1 pyruvate, phosphate dikinase [Goekera deserti]NDI47142.1 pyruvate, phosphate dikinase [Goekera deserti]NEL55460.1 pyruvate, phosphate dikinase [Goekera deserti]